LTLLLLLILITGWLWSYSGPTYLGGFSLIVLHGLLACGLVGLLIWHLVARWYVWRVPAARNRRAVLHLAGVGLVGLALRQLAEPAKFLVQLSGAGRRFTGSYEVGSFTGVFPETSWLFDKPEPIDPAHWQLVVDGAVRQPLTLSYDDVERLANQTESALLDCTGGFYTEQEWTGLPLAWLLEMAEVQPGTRSVTVEAVSGYKRRFSLAVAKTCLLATQVGHKPLSHGHGFPLRLVVPGYRGYDWVKWTTRIRVNKTSHLRQSPLPLQ
jgi:DMSO/TMAO reductase YedYZ molybdopterin-dependent catalytic subunit